MRSPEEATVRFRTVGDATCTGAVRSEALSIDDVITETMASRVSERGATRADDRSRRPRWRTASGRVISEMAAATGPGAAVGAGLGVPALCDHRVGR